MSDPGDAGANDIDRPGIMGDETEEQSLGQPGKKGMRITEGEVQDAFDDARDATGQDGTKEEGDQVDADIGESRPEFWKGFAWGAAVVFAAVCLINRPRHY